MEQPPLGRGTNARLRQVEPTAKAEATRKPTATSWWSSRVTATGAGYKCRTATRRRARPRQRRLPWRTQLLSLEKAYCDKKPAKTDKKKDDSTALALEGKWSSRPWGGVQMPAGTRSIDCARLSWPSLLSCCDASARHFLEGDLARTWIRVVLVEV